MLLGRGLCVGQRSPTECGVSECDREESTMMCPRPIWDCSSKLIIIIITIIIVFMIFIRGIYNYVPETNHVSTV